MVEVAPQERREVGAGLGDDEVVDVEELGDAVEGRLAVVVAAGRGVRVVVVGVGPRAEGRFLGGGPGDDVAVFVLAEEHDGVGGGGGGGVGGDGGGPDELVWGEDV